MDESAIIWIRAGGRCAICKRYLLDEDLGEVVAIGEVAHIVGRSEDARSPRGQHALPLNNRDEMDNLVLLCRDQHRVVDQRKLEPLFTVAKLRDIKREHEAQIKHLTGMAAEGTTAVLRVVGDVRGDPVVVDKATAAAATVHDKRFPYYELDFQNRGVEIDLRQLPNEGTDLYWVVGKSKVDQELERLRQAIRAGKIQHISVFAFARLPLLVHLGVALDDTVPIAIYQWHRATGLWVWADNGPIIDFVATGEAEIGCAEEAVLIVNVSGTIHHSGLPQPLQLLPFYRIEPVEVTPHVELIQRSETLCNFERAVRKLLGTWEKAAKSLRRVHLFVAAPVSAAVVLGRVLDPQVNPHWLVYDRRDAGGYQLALETP
jgi:hypothetical protein